MTSVKIYRPGTMLLVALLALTALCSCINEDMAGCPEGTYHNDDAAYLVLKIGTISPQTRATADLPSNEKMHSLRIVMLDKEGKVEYNNVKTFSSGTSEVTQIIRTEPGDKKLFLIANEESVTTVQGVEGSNSSLTNLLDGKAVGATGFEAMAKSIYFSQDFTQNPNIVLSSYYEFNIGESDLGKQVSRDFYLVHAATKFEFEFENQCLSDISIESLTLNKIADNMYLFAHFNENNNGETLTTNYGGGKNWIDWLQEVSEETTQHPDLTDNPDTDNKTINEKYGWLTYYTLPSAANHSEKTLVSSTDSRAIAAGGTFKFPTVYYPESKNPSTSNDASHSQDYSFTVKLKDNSTTGESMDPTEKEWTLSLTEEGNVKTLFRNTHVKVHVEVRHHVTEDIELALRIGICPWVEETIDIPPFD